MTFGIVLVVVGAVMKFAITVHAHGFNIHVAGLILLWVGIAIFVLSLLLLVLGAGVAARCERMSARLPQAKSGPSSRTTGARPDGSATVIHRERDPAMRSASRSPQHASEETSENG